MHVRHLAFFVLLCVVTPTARIAALQDPVGATRSENISLELHATEVLVARSVGGAGVDMLASVAICGDDRLVLAQSRDNAAVALDHTGKLRWRRPFRAEIASVTCDETHVYVALLEDEWSLWVLSLRTGDVQKTIPIETERAERVRLLGMIAGFVAVQVDATATPFGPPLALQYPTRTVRLYDRSSGSFEDVFVAVDSSPQVAPALGEARHALPLRTPFAARPSLAVVADSLLAYSNGYSFALQYYGPDGRLLKVQTLEGSVPDWTAAKQQAMIAQWKLARSKLFPDSLLVRAAMLDTTRRGLSIGQLVGSPTGELLVHRRDVDDNPIDQQSARRYDLLSADGTKRGSFTLPAGTVAYAFSGLSVVAIRSVMTNATPPRFSHEELVVFRLQHPARQP